ncbi:hypothetical protein OS493_006291 [Desmophyllum pertusum]|uniref:Uncharacterized protein n=1 Tax=Desmophyllum pertusum TaxID=174260 RepID=A0A9X0A4I6_9CNID|nr:hypothetical protein OS493_006291 [Desmophyllum pertusum]
MEELAWLIPEARKQIQLGHRFKTVKDSTACCGLHSLQSNKKNESFQQWNATTIDDNASYQHGCQCIFCVEPFQQCANETKMIFPNDDPNLRFSRQSDQHSQHHCSSLEDLQHSPSGQNGYTDQRQPGEEVAMDTASTPPLQALRSLCSSISPEVLPTAPASSEGLSTEAYSRSELNSIPQIPLPTADVPPPLVPESQGLWRPWEMNE